MATLSPDHPLSRALDARREHINARVSAALRANPRLRAEAVQDFLVETLAPLAEVIAAVDPARGPETVERLVEVALPLLGRDLLGPAARSPALGQGWAAMACWPSLLVAEPVRLARAISNAMYNLGNQQGARPLEWIERMSGVAAESVETLLEVGRLAAWRAGLAHAREGALSVACTLPPSLAGTALGLPIASTRDRDRMIDRLVADRWADPLLPPDAPRQLRVVAEIGGFRGLGGPFVRPPRVVMADAGLVAFDGESAYTVAADRFGATFRRTHPPEVPTVATAMGLLTRLTTSLLGRKPSGLEAGPVLGADGTLRWSGLRASFPVLAGANSQAHDGQTLAVTHPSSHSLFLVGAVPETDRP